MDKSIFTMAFEKRSRSLMDAGKKEGKNGKEIRS